MTTFEKALEIVESFPADQRRNLIEIIRRRLDEEGRDRIVTDTRSARRQLRSGRVRRGTVDDLLRELPG